jgi:hypothetical protein
MRWPLAVALALVLAPPASAVQTFRAPIVPPTIDPGCDYGSRDCAYPSYHAGIDYLGDDPPNEVVRATADGEVKVAATVDESHGFGNAVILEHRLADGGGAVYSLYGHLASRPTVRVGQCVTRGSSLGLQGDTGDTSDVSLHFEIKRDARFGPPYGYAPGPPGEYGYFDPKSFIGKRRAKSLCRRVPPGCVRSGAVRIGHPREGAELARESLLVTGRARAGAAAAGCRVELALRRKRTRGCSWWRPQHGSVQRGCRPPRWFTAATVSRRGTWRYRVPRPLPAGRYAVLARLVDQPSVLTRFKLR